MSVKDPHTIKAKSYHIEEYKNFSKMCYYSTTAVASPNRLAAVGKMRMCISSSSSFSSSSSSSSSSYFLQEAKKRYNGH
jgi:hypothetical protein